MEALRMTNLNRVLKSALFSVVLLCVNQSVFAANDWTGTTSSSWAVATNWSAGHVPLPTEAVTIGVVSFKNQPTLSSAGVTGITSLTFGVLTSTLTGSPPVTLTINSGSTLAVSGPVIQNHNSALGGSTTNITGQAVAGVLGGAITCASFNIGDNTAPPTPLPLLGLANSTNNTTVNLAIGSFTITGSGSVTLNSTSHTTALLGLFPSSNINNPTLNLNDGNFYVGNSVITTNSAYVNTPGFSILFVGLFPAAANLSQLIVNPPGNATGTTPNLYLGGATALNLAASGSLVDFYGAGNGISTINYNGADQLVYTNTAVNVDKTPKVYYNLILSGTGIKTTAAGTLETQNDITATTGTVNLSTNNSPLKAGNNFNNAANVIQGAGDITVLSALTNNSGGTLSLSSGNLLIAGNYTNNAGGSYIQQSGTTYFNGTNQTLLDNSSAGTQFKKVVFQNTGTATMMAGTGNFAVAPSGLLTMISPAQLAAGSTIAPYLTLMSDTTGSATVAAIPATSAITGFVTAQRFVQGSSVYDAVKQRWKARNYRLMSSPVNEGPDGSSKLPYSLNYLAATTIITGCTSTFGAKGGNPSLYLYNEMYTPDNSTFTSGNFKGVTNISSTTAGGTISTSDATIASPKVYAGDGFMIYYRGDKITHITGTPSKTSYPYVAPESVVFSATGNLTQGPISVNSWTGITGLMFSTSNYPNNSAVQGFNLVGNPYASSIDWSTFSNSSTGAAIYGKNVDPSIYILNPTTNNYDTYIAGGAATGNAGKTIPAGQGFFVHANNTNATLTFKEAAKTTVQVTGSNLLLGTSAPQLAVQQLLKLKLIADSLNYDDIVIGFNAAASSLYSGNEDAIYLPGYNSQEGLSSYSSDGMPLAINFLPLPKKTALQIPLNVTAAKSGTYNLKKIQLDAIPQIYRLWLIDSYKKDSLDLRANSDYLFDIDLTDSASYGRNRFKLRVLEDPALAVHLLNFTAVKAAQGVQLQWSTENEQNYTGFTVERSTDNGTAFSVLGGFASTAAAKYSYLDRRPVIAQDSYRLKIEDLNGVFSYSNVITLNYGSGAGTAAATGNLSVYPNPANSVINMAVNKNPTVTNASYTSFSASNYAVLSSAPSASASSYAIRIINMNGSVVKTVQSDEPSCQTDVSELNPGTYVIQVVDNADQSLVGKSVFTKL